MGKTGVLTVLASLLVGTSLGACSKAETAKATSTGQAPGEAKAAVVAEPY